MVQGGVNVGRGSSVGRSAYASREEGAGLGCNNKITARMDRNTADTSSIAECPADIFDITSSSHPRAWHGIVSPHG
jgi:hypothetical protein